jgi:hypothetical protein
MPPVPAFNTNPDRRAVGQAAGAGKLVSVRLWISPFSPQLANARSVTMRRQLDSLVQRLPTRRERALRILEKGEKHCRMSASISTPIRVEPAIEEAR